MAKLFSKTTSDSRGKIPATRIGHKRIESSIYYGSANDSKPLVSVDVVWLNGEKYPIVFVDLNVNANLNILLLDDEGKVSEKKTIQIVNRS